LQRKVSIYPLVRVCGQRPELHLELTLLRSRLHQ